MAIFHLSVKTIGRAHGRSATAAAAYRCATRIEDERTGLVHDYSRKGGVVHREIVAPDGGTLSFSYSGSLLLSQTWAGTTAGSVAQTYDNDFRIATQSVNGANSVAFTYDADSLLTQVGAMTLTPDAQNGLLRATSLGIVSDTYDYSPFGELGNHRAAAGATELFNVTYQRDALGRITEKTEVVEGTATTYAYVYDAAGQLDQVRRDGALIADYNYDANGNRTSLVTPGGTTTGTYDDQDRLLLTYGAATYSYTPDGRLRTKVQGGLPEARTWTLPQRQPPLNWLTWPRFPC